MTIVHLQTELTRDNIKMHRVTIRGDWVLCIHAKQIRWYMTVEHCEVDVLFVHITVERYSMCIVSVRYMDV
jgi:hypothetical protein